MAAPTRASNELAIVRSVFGRVSFLKPHVDEAGTHR